MLNLSLKDELTLLRSAVAGLVGKDKEGKYRPEFVAEALDSVSRKPTETFASSDDFLKAVELEK